MIVWKWGVSSEKHFLNTLAIKEMQIIQVSVFCGVEESSSSSEERRKKKKNLEKGVTSVPHVIVLVMIR